MERAYLISTVDTLTVYGHHEAQKVEGARHAADTTGPELLVGSIDLCSLSANCMAVIEIPSTPLATVSP